MEYCLDTSVFTEAHRRYYDFDIAPGFWVAIENNIVNGKIVSPMMVKKEIDKGKDKDQLVTWAKDMTGSLFIEADTQVEENMHIVADFIENKYENASEKEQFLRYADPWVIAQAMAYDLIVVTAEIKNPNEPIDKITQKIKGQIKIPNVCEKVKIQWIDTFQLLRRLNIKLGLI